MQVLKIVLALVLGILIAAIISESFELWNSGMWQLKKSIFKKYEQEKIREVLKKKLGENYSDNIKQDFDNFVINIVMEEINKKETEHLRRYNAFITREEMSKSNELGVQQTREIYGKPVNDSIYYIHIKSFHKKESYKNMKKYIPEMKNYDNIIIDLKDNTGGYFDSLRDISNLFLKEDDFVYAKKKKGGEVLKEYHSKNDKELSFSSIIILTNKNTASVSELFILVLANNLDNVTVMGTPTRGKSIVYSIRKFKDGTGYRFISGIMEGPGGSRIPEGGIIPDIIIEDEEKQLEKAISYINNNFTN